MSSSAQPSSSTQPAPVGGVVGPTPTLAAYPVLESLFNTLKPYLDLSRPLPTDAGMKEALAMQILCKLEVLVSPIQLSSPS